MNPCTDVPVLPFYQNQPQVSATEWQTMQNLMQKKENFSTDVRIISPISCSFYTWISRTGFQAVMWLLGKEKLAFSYRDARKDHIQCEGLTLVLLHNCDPRLCRCWLWYSQPQPPTPNLPIFAEVILLARLQTWPQLSVHTSSWLSLGCSSDWLMLQLIWEQVRTLFWEPYYWFHCDETIKLYELWCPVCDQWEVLILYFNTERVQDDCFRLFLLVFCSSYHN